MKASHYTTPRTLSECNFALNADPIDRPTHTSDTWGRYGMAILLIVAIFAVFAIVMGKP